MAGGYQFRIWSRAEPVGSWRRAIFAPACGSRAAIDPYSVYFPHLLCNAQDRLLYFFS
jgi:hypothetical protein